MSQIGTGIAAGVAQTTYQASEQSVRKAKKTRDKDSKTQRLSDQFEQHMLALDEGDADGDQAPAQLRVNELLPEQNTIHPETDQTQAAPGSAPNTDQPPHPHLDIQA